MMDTDVVVSKAAQAAAAWWVKALERPKMDNGVPEHGGFAQLLQAGLPDQPPDAFEAFGRELAREIQVQLDAGHREVILQVDYGPDLTLRAASSSPFHPIRERAGACTQG